MELAEKIYHGTAIAKEDMSDLIKKGDIGIITAYLPEDRTFAIFFGNDKKWHTYHENEIWFLNHFDIIQETYEFN